jgi:organic radical activating enzyme
MANSFCKYLSNGLRVQSDWGKLMVNPCCLVRTPMVYLTDPQFDQKMDKFHNALDCQDCRHENYHMRDRATSEISGDPKNGVISFLELSIDIDCNAACLSCTDSFSSAWVSQNKKFKIKTVDDYPDPQDDIAVVNDLFEKFDLSQLQKVSFMGGEPFRAKTTELFLTKLIDLYPTSNTDLLFTTNASIKPSQNLILLMSKFKSVSVIFSIDGTGEKFEYLRYPLSWSKVCNTIEYFKTLDIDRFSITYTLNPFNIYYYNELVDWANTTFKDDKRMIGTGPVPAGGIIGLQTLPAQYKEVLLEKYTNYKRLTQIILSLPVSNTTNQQMMNYISQMDNFRNLSWKDTFPEIVHYFD